MNNAAIGLCPMNMMLRDHIKTYGGSELNYNVHASSSFAVARR
jgi:hypothetical protein